MISMHGDEGTTDQGLESTTHENRGAAKNIRSRKERHVSKQSTECMGNINKVPGKVCNRPAASPINLRSNIGRPADVNGIWQICRERQEALQQCIMQTRHQVRIFQKGIKG